MLTVEIGMFMVEIGMFMGEIGIFTVELEITVEIGMFMVEVGMFTVEIEITVEIGMFIVEVGMFTVEIEITVEIGMFMVEIEIPDLSDTIPGQAMGSTESHHVGLPSSSFSVTCSLCLGCVDMLLILLHLYCVHWAHFRCKCLKNTLTLHFTCVGNISCK